MYATELLGTLRCQLANHLLIKDFGPVLNVYLTNCQTGKNVF